MPNNLNTLCSGNITHSLHSGLPLLAAPQLSLDTVMIPPPKIEESVLSEYTAMIKNIWPSVDARIAAGFKDFANVYQLVVSQFVPNFLGAQIQVKSGLNLAAWHANLIGYHDAEIFYYLRYGWPLGYSMKIPPVSVDKNHQSAVAHRYHIEQFIDTELGHEAITGPFDAPPFVPWTRVSPMMTRIKKDSELRRVIVDLSFPPGQSVNTGIDTSSVLGKNISYTLPSITDLITRLRLVGSGAYIWKADLARAYRQLRTDPIDTPLLGVTFDQKIYIDNCPPFGCRSSSAVCQRTANAVVYMLARQGHHCIAYLDDFSGCESVYIDADKAFNCFVNLAGSLGL